MIPLTETTFRRLAQSSPWRFTGLHFSWAPGESTFEPVEAWLTRPGRVEVLTARGERHHVDEHLAQSAVFGVDDDGTAVSRTVENRPPQDFTPEVDENGLVVSRPTWRTTDQPIGDADPMWQTYTWVAMLDPRELSSGTTVADLVESERHGRRTWWATVAALDEGYEPRCGCCPLLWGEVSERQEAADGGPTYAREHPDVVYPQSWLIGLDTETGVVVSAQPHGGSRPDAGFENTIHEVTP